MRSVWGWTPASSAATEIPHTARSRWSAMSSPSPALASVDAEVVPRRGVGQRSELAQQVPLLARELLGHGHLQADQQVAGALTAGARHPPPPDPEDAAVLGAGWNLDRHRTIQGRHLELGPEGGLGEGHRDGDGQVLAAAPEQRVRGDPDLDDQVAGGGAGLAGLALALEPDGGPVVDPDRDPDPQLPGADLAAPALAGGAGVVDHRAAALTGRAGAGEAEQALVAGDRAPAVAGRAGPGQGPGLGPRAVAGVAGRRAAQLERDGGPANRLLEPEGDLALDVAAAPGRGLGPPAPAEQVAEQVAEPAQVLDPDPAAAGEAAPATGEAAEAAAPERARGEQPAGLVVLGPFLGVGQHGIGPPDLLEALLGGLVALVGVRVVLLGELPVGLLDVGRRRVLGHAEVGVEVLLQVLGVVHPLLRDLHHGGAKDLAPQLVAGPHDVHDHARLGVLLLDGDHRLVALGVEGLALGLDPDQALALQDLAERPEDHLDALEHAVEVARLLGRGHGQLEVVEHRQQPGHQRLGGGGGPGRLLAQGALAVVVEVGLEPAQVVEVALGLGPGLGQIGRDRVLLGVGVGLVGVGLVGGLVGPLGQGLVLALLGLLLDGLLVGLFRDGLRRLVVSLLGVLHGVPSG